MKWIIIRSPEIVITAVVLSAIFVPFYALHTVDCVATYIYTSQCAQDAGKEEGNLF